MSGVVELLYAPSDKDRLSGLFQRRWGFNSNPFVQNAAVVSTGALQIVPADTVRVVTGVSLIVTPTAAIAARQGTVRFTQGSAVLAEFTFSRDAAAVAQAIGESIAMEFLMLPGDSFFASGVFTGAGVLNSVDVTVWGYEIPRANVQR